MRVNSLANITVNSFCIPVLTMIVTYTAYVGLLHNVIDTQMLIEYQTLLMKKQLTASRVFSSMTVFDILQENLHTVFGFLPMIIQGEYPITLIEVGINIQIAKVSLDRVNEFVHQVLAFLNTVCTF